MDGFNFKNACSPLSARVVISIAGFIQKTVSQIHILSLFQPHQNQTRYESGK